MEERKVLIKKSQIFFGDLPDEQKKLWTYLIQLKFKKKYKSFTQTWSSLNG